MSKFSHQNKDNPVVIRAHIGTLLNMTNAQLAILNGEALRSGYEAWRNHLNALKEAFEHELKALGADEN